MPKRNFLLKLICFMSFIYFGMGLSKTIHPLWFLQCGHLPIFGFACAVMAGVGAFTFLMGFLGQHWGFKKIIYIGCVLYSIALFLRIFTGSYWIAGLSGICGGLGAGSIVLCMKAAAFIVDNSDPKIRFVTYENTTMNASFALGAIAAGMLVDYLGELGRGYILTLMAAALLPLLALFLIPKELAQHLSPKNENTLRKSISNIAKGSGSLAIALVLLNILAGMYTSLVVPYLPVIFSKVWAGQVQWIGWLVGICSLVAIGVQLLAKRILKTSSCAWIFVFSQAVFAFATLGLAYIVDPICLVIIALARAVFSALGFVTHELVELKFLNKEHAISLLVIMQSAFLVGDIFGSGIAGYLYTLFGVHIVTQTAAVLIFLEGILLIGMVGWNYFKNKKIFSQSYARS